MLKNLKNSFDGKQIFCFEVMINELFAENFDKTQLFRKNMLYRPCLVKLVDPDDPTNWRYHLREQKLPFFITLAHEFLHALNQLEKIEQYWNLALAGEYYRTQDILTVLGSKTSMQDFLSQKLQLEDSMGILKNNYLTLWGNENNDDFLDEMTVILGSKRKIDLRRTVFIGETSFLQEFYDDGSI